MDSGQRSAVRHVVVEADRKGQRLDNFLIGQLDGVPRSLVYRLVRTGQVRVNGARAKPMQKLKSGDEVRIPPVAEKPARPVCLPDGLVADLKRRIIHDDDRMLVIDKPSGLAVHGGSGLHFGLMDAADKLGANLKPVHRLDRATSGLLVLARGHQALTELGRAFRQRQVEKKYLALLHGRLAEDSVVVDAPLAKQRDGSGQFRSRVSEQGAHALSRFKVLERIGDYSFVEVEIETGRTHQIRAHAAHIGHPVVGDERYNEVKRDDQAPRLFLHAHFLRLPWPEEAVFSAPLPDELGQFLEQLRGHRPSRSD